MTKAVSRRKFLERSALAAGALALPVSAQRARAASAAKPVTLLLDWLFQGPNTGFMVAKEKGYYRDAGLDVADDARQGLGQYRATCRQQGAQFGFSDGFVVGTASPRACRIKTVGSIYRRNPCAVMVLADSDIKAPKDLEGKTIAITAGSCAVPAVARLRQGRRYRCRQGPDGQSSIRPASGRRSSAARSMPLAATSELCAEHRNPRQEGGAHILVCRPRRDRVSNGIIVHDDLLKSDPELVRAFVPPTIKGFLYGRQHPDEAVADREEISVRRSTRRSRCANSSIRGRPG